MISGIPFYNSLFKKYVIIFGTLFNNISIERKDSNGNLVQKFKVPIAYGPREKFLARLEENPDAAALTAIKVPRIAFEISGIQYDASRKLQSVNKIVSKKNINGVNVYDKVHNPVPYNISFRMDILSKTMEDGLRIIEQVMPYFTPEWTVSAKLLGNDFDNVTDIPLVLESVSIDDEYAADFLSRRILTFTLNFTMKCYFFGPVTESKIIKLSEVKMYPLSTTDTEYVTTTVRPGLTADGEPTSNAALSVALSQIEEDDNYGFIVTIEENYA